MSKMSSLFVTKIKLSIALFQTQIMNKILTSFSKSKRFRKSDFAVIFEKRLVKKRETVNKILKSLMLSALENKSERMVKCSIVELSQYAKGA